MPDFWLTLAKKKIKTAYLSQKKNPLLRVLLV